MDQVQAERMYGSDCQEWLRRWEAGETVWSIEMGGLGPGYEQAIQITVAEILRYLMSVQYDAKKWKDTVSWKEDRDLIESWGMEHPPIKKLQLSGAMWGAALSLAARLYMDGPVNVMSNEQVKDRHIQVRREFPGGLA